MLWYGSGEGDILECPTYESSQEIQWAASKRRASGTSEKPSRSNLCRLDERLNGSQRISWDREILDDENNLQGEVGNVVEAEVHVGVDVTDARFLNRVADVIVEGIESILALDFIAIGCIAELHECIAVTIDLLERQGVHTTFSTTWIQKGGGNVQGFDVWKEDEVGSTPVEAIEEIRVAHVEGSDGLDVDLVDQRICKLELWAPIEELAAKLNPVMINSEVDLALVVGGSEHRGISLAGNGIKKS